MFDTNKMAEVINTAWLDDIPKEQLVSIAQELGIECAGTAREIRKRITALAAKAHTDPEIHTKFQAIGITNRDNEAASEDEDEHKTPVPPEESGESTSNFMENATRSQLVVPSYQHQLPLHQHPPTTTAGSNAGTANPANRPQPDEDHHSTG
ncbi:PREDICTED: uncharacterized protein LOC108382461 [Rhagoletis zephyria]|uniref:uncharacterized protein LOC108382461 n=1 Tax=Rhagoletis zephyria TaxID=28612 RepID=UPI0008118501|nr:PREDICTED: uncharacterized protein LOC108382461 [Rhagoletis zephyria]